MRRAFDKAAHAPITETFAVSTFNKGWQVDLRFLGDIDALHVADVFSEYSLLTPGSWKNPQEGRDAFC